MSILHTAAAALKLATFSPEATELNNYVADAHKEAKTEQINFASEIITTNTHDKVLAITNFQNPAKLETLDGDPPTAAEIIKGSQNLKGGALRDYLLVNGVTKEYLGGLISEAKSNHSTYKKVANNLNKDISRIRSMHATEFGDKYTSSQTTNLENAEATQKFYLDRMNRLEEMERALNLPTAEEMADLAATGVTSIDDVPNHEVLSKIFAELQITTKMDGEMVKVYINGENTYYKFKPGSYKEFSIYPVPAENGISFAVIFDKLKKDKTGENGEIIKGKHYLTKLARKNGEMKVIKTSGYSENKLAQPKPFKLSPK